MFLEVSQLNVLRIELGGSRVAFSRNWAVSCFGSFPNPAPKSGLHGGGDARFEITSKDLNKMDWGMVAQGNPACCHGDRPIKIEVSWVEHAH